jgi:hypothetical protein
LRDNARLEIPGNVGERLLLTLWVGGLWTIGYVVAPSLFYTLDDRQLAGAIAGRLFTVISYIGLACAALLLLGAWFRLGREIWRSWRAWSVLAMLALVLIGHFGLQPLMAELKLSGLVAGSESALRFGRLHGISSVLYLLNSILGLLLVAASGSTAAAGRIQGR